MAKTLEEMIAEETPAVQAKIEARYRELIAEAKSLAEVRKLAACSQEEVARKLQIKQPSISRLEKQTDMYISTLKQYVEAAGGTLKLIVELPDQKALSLTGLGDLRPPKHINTKPTVLRA